MKIIIIVIVVILLIWTIGSWMTIKNLEEPAYSVISKEDGYEIRMYEPYIIAETTVDGSYDEALNQGFRNIADYIFGNNTTSEKVAMTTPVIESDNQDLSEKIAMTIPVLNEENPDSKRVISFVMPSKYTLETLPKPNTDYVTLKEIPARKVAVLQFTWYANEERVEKKKNILAQKLTDADIEITSNFSSAYYNPPLSMPLLLRNEILVEIR